MQRDLRIDVIRGGGILMIAVDHLGGLAQSIALERFTMPFPTWTRIGWSSAAEFFVFFSGYILAVVYSQTLQRRGIALLHARALHRAWQIHVANLLTFCAVLVLLRTPALASPELENVSGIAGLAVPDAMSGIAAFLTLQYSPAFFEVLHLYIVLLLVAPSILLLARASMLAAMACSAGIWLCVQWNPLFNLPGWHFNPFAWQLIFVLGMICSLGRLFEKLSALFTRRSLLAVSGAFLSAALLIKACDKSGWAIPLAGTIDVAGIDKTTLGPLRILHFVASVIFVMQIVPSAERIARSRMAQAVARVGQRSLECFCLSTIFAYAAVAALARMQPFGAPLLLAIGCLAVVLLCSGAWLVQWLKAEPWRTKSSRSPACTGRTPAAGVDTTQRSMTHARQ